jgi:hypothetical protein
MVSSKTSRATIITLGVPFRVPDAMMGRGGQDRVPSTVASLRAAHRCPWMIARHPMHGDKFSSPRLMATCEGSPSYFDRQQSQPAIHHGAPGTRTTESSHLDRSLPDSHAIRN